MGLMVARVSLSGNARGWTPLGDRIRSPISSQTYPTGRSGESSLEISRRENVFNPRRAGLWSQRGTDSGVIAGRPGAGGDAGALFVARARGNLDCFAASRIARPQQCARARTLNVLFRIRPTSFPKNGS